MFWRKQYEQGVPGEIDPDKVVPLVDYLRNSAQQHPNATAASNFGKKISYAELDQESRAFSAGLIRQFGLEPHDRVAIMLPNIIQFPVAVFGILRAGMVVVNVNPLYTPRELEHQLVDSGASAIIILENFAHTLERVLEKTAVKHVVIARVGDCLPPAKAVLLNTVIKYVKKAVPNWNILNAVPYKTYMGANRKQNVEDYDSSLDDNAFLQYTGGTTGVAKGVVLTHRNVSSNIQQGLCWAGSRFKPGQEVAITALPLYHIFALTANLMFMVATAGNCVLITNPRDFKGFVKELKKWRMTYITGVNTLYAALLNTPGIDQVDFSQLKIALGAGMAVTSPVARRWKEVTHKLLLEVYGLSETSPAATMNRFDLEDYNGLVGLPIPSTEVIIIDPDGRSLGTGEEGELCIRGPQVMPGYWQNKEETDKVFTEQGYFKTGDFAMMDEQGYIKILDRKKDMILVSGFNVYPNEIEDVVSDHPDIREVAAIGVEDEKSGERVRLYVVSDNPNLDQETLIDWCRENMTNYKVPKSIEFRQELPKSAVGKILRKDLRD